MHTYAKPNRAYLAGRRLEGTVSGCTTVPVMLHWLNPCNAGSQASQFARPYRGDQDKNASSAFQAHYTFI